MTAAGMARHIFRQSIYPKERNVFGNCSFLRLKYPHTGSVQLVQRSAANASNNYCIHLMTAKPRYRIAGPMLMDLITVVDRRHLVGRHIHYYKPRSRAKMPIHPALHPLIIQNRKTDFHCVPPTVLCICTQYIFKRMNVNIIC